MFHFLEKEKISQLPNLSGVYAFLGANKEMLYIGKAINLKERVKNHFLSQGLKENIFVRQSREIGFIITESEIEALILEAELIKKYQSKYNTIWRDGKSHLYVFITKEEFPRVFVDHLSPKIFNLPFAIYKKIGPFIDGSALKQALRVLRRVFPFRTCKRLPKKPCLYKELKLCPAPCSSTCASLSNIKKQNNVQTKNAPKQETQKYNNNIKSLIKVLEGKKQSVLNSLKKQMRQESQKENFEKAKEIKEQLMALEKIFQHSHIFQKEIFFGNWKTIEGLLQKILFSPAKKQKKSKQRLQRITRIEAYDISNIQGASATGSMIVFENGSLQKNYYRRFHIRIEGKPNDTAMLKEVLQRRFQHKEWALPQLILLDGGKAQLKAGLHVKKLLWPALAQNIIFTALAKRNNELFCENWENAVLLKNLPPVVNRLFIYLRDEAHRFALQYHQQLRKKKILPSR